MGVEEDDLDILEPMPVQKLGQLEAKPLDPEACRELADIAPESE